MQDVFKKAAYLSTGSVDSRPTFQRDAVDDDSTGSGTGIEGINAISWKDMAPRGPLLGAAYGSLVMPQFKGKRNANRQKKLPSVVPDVSFEQRSQSDQLWRLLQVQALPVSAMEYSSAKAANRSTSCNCVQMLQDPCVTGAPLSL